MDSLAKSEDSEMHSRGFTLVELLVVIGVLAILFSLTSINLVSSQRRTSQGEALALLTSDIRTQQLKAMLGDSSGVAPSSYGIYFESDDYILFKGSSYSSSDPANYKVELDPGYVFSPINFPNSVIIFSRGSGEISNFSQNTYDLVLSDTQDGQSNVITVNRYGTISNVN